MKKNPMLTFVVFFALILNLVQSNTSAFALLDSATTQYLTKGDAAYDAFDNQAALDNYMLAFKADSNNCEAAWKISRAYVDLGEQAQDEQQIELYNKAETFARKAVGICPDNDESHFNLAVAVGRVALKEGGKTKVSLSKEVKEEAMKALKLNDNHDGAHHVLARWHREVANLSGTLKLFAKILYGGLPPASNEDAIKHFQKAIQIKPDHINHHLELGITYEQLKNWELAKAQYDRVLELPVKDADDNNHKEEAQKRLAKVAKKIK